MILVLGSVLVREGCLDEALRLSREDIARSRLEPGCISHDVHQDAGNTQRLVFVEQWADHAALTEHFKVPASRQFAKSLGALATQPPSMQIFHATPVVI